MAQHLPEGYRIDPEDPRAPTEEQWARMSPAERAWVVDALPSSFPLDELAPPEGDTHYLAYATARSTLDGFFRRIGRKIYISSNLAVYYPGERMFSPDVIAVRDVEPHTREKWVMATEGKGLDFALEVYFAGDRTKDEVDNVERYARLGIPEYFFFDSKNLILRGYRLPAAERAGEERRVYRPILPQAGRYASEVLGLDLILEDSRLRFLHGSEPVPEADELIAKLGSALADAERRAQEQAEHIDSLEREVAALRAEMARLRGEK